MIMAAKRKLILLVSSAVYGFEELLDRIYTELVGFDYEVWMSHKGTSTNGNCGWSKPCHWASPFQLANMPENLPREWLKGRRGGTCAILKMPTS